MSALMVEFAFSRWHKNPQDKAANLHRAIGMCQINSSADMAQESFGIWHFEKVKTNAQNCDRQPTIATPTMAKRLMTGAIMMTWNLKVFAFKVWRELF